MVALYRDDRVWVANAGDSRAVLGTQEREALVSNTRGEEDPSGLASISASASTRLALVDLLMVNESRDHYPSHLDEVCCYVCCPVADHR